MDVNMSLEEKEKLVKKLKKKLKDKSIPEVIKIAYEEFGDMLAMTTAFGYTGIVLMSFVKDTVPEIPIYFIDTRLHFEETLKLAEMIKNEWKLNIIHLTTEYSDEELDELIGEEIYKTNPDLCCEYRKTKPLLKILKTKIAWLSAVRRDQSPSRAKIDVIGIDGRGTIKINPMYKWTRDDTWMYIRKYALPYNPLHDQYYPSIGCKPCTQPVDKGGDERDGRWRGFQKVECGIHDFSEPENKVKEKKGKK